MLLVVFEDFPQVVMASLVIYEKMKEGVPYSGIETTTKLTLLVSVIFPLRTLLLYSIGTVISIRKEALRDKEIEL